MKYDCMSLKKDEQCNKLYLSKLLKHGRLADLSICGYLSSVWRVRKSTRLIRICKVLKVTRTLGKSYTVSKKK